MRICFVSSYPPNHARLSEYAKNLVGELAHKPGIAKLNLLADQVEGLNRKSYENSKIEILRVWKQDNPFSILSTMIQILRLKPDVVHFSVGFQSFGKTRIANFAGLSLIFLCRLCNLKVIVLLHNLGETVDLEKVMVKPSFVNRMGILVATKLVLSASKVAVMVKSYAKYLREHYHHPGILFIPHGATANNRLSIDPEEKIVLMFGHMGPSKGLPVMLQAFEKMLKERENIQLIVAGDNHPNFPNYTEQFRSKAYPKVAFLGYIPEEKLSHVFGMADVVVTPYLVALGTSGVFHLACSFGKPVVSSDLPEIREIVNEGASALLVPPGDAEALKNALLKVLFDEKLSAKMSDRNESFAQKERWSVVAQAYEEAYLELASS